MGLAELTHSMAWKKFMAKVYGWGAAVVLIGAMFKIQHWEGASIMLVVGLGVEAFIFFSSSFEPIHEELDWTLVYPELAGLNEDDEVDAKKEKSKKPLNALEKFDQMLENSGISQDIFDKLGNGLKTLNKTASQLSDISDASAATVEFTSNLKNAAGSVNTLSDSYKKSAGEVTSSVNLLSNAYKQSAESLSYSSDGLADVFGKSSQQVTASNTKFIDSYQNLIKSMDIDFDAFKNGNKKYSEGVATLNKNLAALNAIFELQLQEADLDQMMSDLQGSVEHSKKYHNEITKLGDKLEKLNVVYGNILTAMNVSFK